MGAWVPQAPGVYSVNTARTAVPGALAAPRLTAHHSGCAEQALPPLQGCCREQQSKTNSQTQQTYFFDSLNIKKGEKKKKPTNVQQSKVLSPLHSGWGLRVSLAGPWEPRSFEARLCSGALAGLGPGGSDTRALPFPAGCGSVA